MAIKGIPKIRDLLAGPSVDNPPLAATLMVSALFMLGLQDAIVKWASSDISLWQFQFFRSAFNLVLVFVFVRFVLGDRLPIPRRLGAVILRSLLLCGAMVFFFSGVPFLSLAEIAAGLYVFPLFVGVLSHFVLGEKVGPRRMIAILAGFCGTLLILKPGTDGFSPISLLPVGAGFLYACTVLTTRKLCRDESPVTLAMGVAIALLSLGAVGMIVFTPGVGSGPWAEQAAAWPYIFTGWTWVEASIYGVIGICSLLNLTANISLARAYQSAEASWLAPFDFSYLIWATFWGFVIWRDLPDAMMFSGMVLIAASGAFVAWRHQQESRG